MRIATIKTAEKTAAVRVEDDRVVEIAGLADVGELLRREDWQQLAAAADGPAHARGDVELDLLIPQPGKVLCLGLNYRTHILEMGRELPAHPTVFAKFADTLTAPFADVVAIAEDPALDWEGELAFVIGRTAHRVDEADAAGHIAGYTIANDVSMRTWQNRTPEWLQGKMWARSTPVGPYLVTPDEFEPSASALRTLVNGRVVQQESLDDMVFTPAQLVAYLSAIIPLRPGDIVLTGTPGGVGHARRPQEYLAAGDVVEVEIDGIGALRNAIVAAA